MRRTQHKGVQHLRAGLVIEGRMIDERVLGRDGKLGLDAAAGSLVPSGTATTSPVVLLFEARGGRYFVHLHTDMRGQVASRGETRALEVLRGAAQSDDGVVRVELPAEGRGRLRVGAAVVLFHFIEAAPTRVVAPLPPHLQQSWANDIDWMTTVVAAFSFLLHFLAVAVIYSDWTDPVVDGQVAVTQLVEQVRTLPPPPPVEKPRLDAEASASAMASSAVKAPQPKAGTPSRDGAKGRGQGAGAGARASAGDRRAAAIASELAALELQTFAVLNGEGPSTRAVIGDGQVPVALLDESARSRQGVGDGDPGDLGIGDDHGHEAVVPGDHDRTLRQIGNTRRDEDGGSTNVGVARQVEGPRGSAIVAPPAVAVGQVANANSVVAGMRGRFRRCYQQGLDRNPALAGGVTMVARIGPNGEVQSVSGGGGGLGAIVPCLRSVIGGAVFSPPTGGAAVISIPIRFVKR